jgi:hypothetical protein
LAFSKDFCHPNAKGTEASNRPAGIVGPARERILANPPAPIIDLAILAAHECTPGEDIAPGTMALIAAVLGLAGTDPRVAMIG